MTHYGITFDGTRITDGTADLWLNFASAATYAQQRNLMLFYAQHSTSVTIGVNYRSGTNDYEIVATYTLDADKYAIIDLTDVLRMYYAAGQAAVQVSVLPNSAADAWDDPEFTCTFAGLIAPEAFVGLAPNTDADTQILPPPSVMLVGSLDTLVEVVSFAEYHDSHLRLYAAPYAGATGTSYWHQLNAGAQSVNIVANNYWMVYNLRGSGTKLADGTTQVKVCGDFAFVTWLSRFGNMKGHYWRVVKRKVTSADTYSLQRADNAFDTHKGQLHTLTLRLDGLTAYDYWYYADIVTSSSVHVDFSDDTSIADEAQADVEVVTKNVTIPDGNAGKSYTLDVEVNYRRYDAI